MGDQAIELHWRDGKPLPSPTSGRDYASKVLHSMQPATLIDGRLGVKGDYVSTGDNQIPNQVLKEDWEVRRSVYRRHRVDGRLYGS